MVMFLNINIKDGGKNVSRQLKEIFSQTKVFK